MPKCKFSKRTEYLKPEFRCALIETVVDCNGHEEDKKNCPLWSKI